MPSSACYPGPRALHSFPTRRSSDLDTRSGELLPLRPRDQGHVGIYACGPTVYSRIHIGNARPFVIFSLLKRLLEHEGHAATLVINVRSEEHTSELQSHSDLVCRLLLATPAPEPYTLSLPDALPISTRAAASCCRCAPAIKGT